MTVRILRGDCLDVLRTLPADSVHCCVSSPPYYGLRDYGVAGQIGLEATPDAYIATMVEVFRLVRRVLRDDGTVWLNLGDSYASTPSGSFDKGGRGSGALEGGGFRANKAFSTIGNGAKPKDLLLMPARVALALQADGWWLRSDIIWHKPNPMPESVGDRPTSAHEHVFLLAKQPRYFYDADAVREEAEYGRREWSNVEGNLRRAGGNPGAMPSATVSGANPASGRNLRNVWMIATAPYSDAHFATFPPELAERCIKAGTSERGVCQACGAPWVRQVERSVAFTSGSGRAGNVPVGKYNGTEQATSGAYDIRMGPSVTAQTTGWSSSCPCAAACVPAVVLDCFGGAGTVGLVADRLQRDAVLIELNPDYAAMAERRLHRDAGLFAEVATA